ncbi:hypothetical protein DL96DRAFT_1627974 [Flagelloscypha sp. PMI_526]|nr:hypothetical protein DL96DRAFT_1627974 [Flagelloscypha sp. PMI_526]
MTWLAAGFRPASKPTPRLPFSFTSAESQSPSKLYRDQPVRASQTIRPPHIIKPLQTGDDDDDEDEEDDASNASSLSDDLGEGKSYFASVDIAKQLGDALEGTRKDLVAAQAALANKKHSLAFAHNQIRRLRRVSRENRRRHSQKIQKLKHTSKREIMKTDRRHLEEVLVLQKESQVSTADYSQQILTLQDENRDSHQKNVHEIRDLQDQLDVSASRRAEEAQSLKDELKATEEKYLKKLESLQDESRRDKQTVAVLQKERAVMDSLAMKFRRTMSACVITGLVSLQFILVAKNLKEVA